MINVYDGRSEVLFDSSGHINNLQKLNWKALAEHVNFFFSSKDLISWPGRAIALAWCVQQRLATGAVNIVFMSNRALSLNHFYNYSISRGYKNRLSKGQSPLYFKMKPHLTFSYIYIYIFRKARNVSAVLRHLQIIWRVDG